MGVTGFILLSSLGFAIVAQAQQCSKPTPGANMNLKDEYITQDTFADGGRVTFACNPGYTPAGGSLSITCTAGVWSPVRLVCERKNCGALGDVSNGNIDYQDGTEFGDKAVVICNQGYTLVGQSTLRCDVNGWTGRLPVCEVVQCVPPAGIVDGTFTPQKDFYNYNEVVRYSCKKDFTLNGRTQLICSDNGNFSPAPPTCVRVECRDPVIENAEYVSGSRPPHGHNAAVTYTCKSGYKMTGSATVRCGISNTWLPSLPRCTKAPVPPPTIATTGTTTTTTTTTTSVTTTKPAGGGKSTEPWIIVVVVLICGSCFIIIIVFFIRKKRW